MVTNKITQNKSKKERIPFTSGVRWGIYALVFLMGLIPLFGILYLRYGVTDEENLPSESILESQEELLATTIFGDDGVTVLGRYYKVNRTSVGYNEISPNVISALISTEDERFEEHAGIDGKAVARALKSMGKAGGASTISQQLAKLVFTLKEREDKRIADLEGVEITTEEEAKRKMGKIELRLYEKIKENVIALRLEKRYTKKEIITMYLNQFDFLYNAVGIASASRVYFNKKPIELQPEEAAMLVGMCKNPTIYNPYTFNVRNYRNILARRNNISPDKVPNEEIKTMRTEDSLQALERRNTVLFKWYENSKKGNNSLTATLTKEVYDSLKRLPIITSYQRVDHKEGLAPYFRESLRGELKAILNLKDDKGNYVHINSQGKPYDLYEDGLKIYTTINPKLQNYAEQALEKHLREHLQSPFEKNNRRMRNFPFDNQIADATVENLMRSAIRRTDRYRNGKRSGKTDEELNKEFEEPVEMRVFSWSGEIDTIFTPMDSIRYYKNFIRAGLVSIEPQTGFVKAWVGGPNINHFAYDHVKQGKRQVGSTIKPFIYSAGMRFGVITSCMEIPNIDYCIDYQTGALSSDVKSWCPQSAGAEMDGKPTSFASGLAKSLNNITVAVMAKMGATAGPNAVAKLMRDLNIEIRDADIVPAMCLGVMDLSLMEITSAQCAFVNKGIYTAPSSLLRIEDRHGNVIYEHYPIAKEVMSEELAYATLDLMRGVIDRVGGTAVSLRGTWRPWGGITYPTAGKTGTTQNNSDGWFMGLTPDLVTGVWVGAEDMAIRFRSMEWGQGARMALPIYGYMMQNVYKDSSIPISKGEFEVPFGYQNSRYNCRANQSSSSDGDDNPFKL